MDIDIQNSKIELIQWLTTLTDKTIIKKLIELRNTDLEFKFSDLSQEERHSILKGIEEADNGDLKSHAEARKVYEKWL